ncbi:MAG: DUF1801 domain-containing protein [Acidobacteria bacterium]|nr:DUF1801 domain-containing protein [Acidobacteriota bacterium]MCY3964558.1 DUF1801 domain-containing protein [Acidobacteriota bacterium]
MSALKTQLNDANVEEFLAAVENDRRREDSFTVLELMKRVTGEKPRMWGTSIVGFGSYHYRYASGREGDWPRIGFSPRKQSLTIYVMPGFSNYDDLLSRLGKHRTGKSCLYVNKLADVDMDVLEQLMRSSLDAMREMYPD